MAASGAAKLAQAHGQPKQLMPTWWVIPPVACTNHELLSNLPIFKISWCACRDDQTSADTTEGGEAVGAMSYVCLSTKV